AAADIEEQGMFSVLRPTALHSEMNEARLFTAGNDFDRRPRSVRGAMQEFPLIARVADGAGSHYTHTDYVEPAVKVGHAREDRAGRDHSLFADGSVTEYALAEAGDFAVGGENAGRLAGDDFGGFHADGVAADVDGRVPGHGSMIAASVQWIGNSGGLAVCRRAGTRLGGTEAHPPFLKSS